MGSFEQVSDFRFQVARGFRSNFAGSIETADPPSSRIDPKQETAIWGWFMLQLIEILGRIPYNLRASGTRSMPSGAMLPSHVRKLRQVLHTRLGVTVLRCWVGNNVTRMGDPEKGP